MLLKMLPLQVSLLDTFQPLTTEQVLVLIKRPPDKTLELDPVPTWFVQEFAPIFAPFLRMSSMLVLQWVTFLLRRKGRLFIQVSRNHRLTLMICLTIVPFQTLALSLSCLSGLFMLMCFSI